MKSNHFKESEIKSISYENGKPVIYLKLGVKRLKYETLDYDDCSQLNQELIATEQYLKRMDQLGLTEIDEDYN